MNVLTKVILIAAFIFYYLPNSTLAQAPDTLWTKVYGGLEQEQGQSVQQTADLGYIASGAVEDQWLRMWLLKTNEGGNIMWEKRLQINNDDFGASIQQTSDGGYIVTGTTQSFGEESNLVLVRLESDSPVVVNDAMNLILDYELSQNYPNPFNPSTTIKYQIPELSFVTLKVYDVLGIEVATLINGEKPVGSYEVEFDGTGLPSGVYFYRLKTGSYFQTRKMVLLK